MEKFIQDVDPLSSSVPITTDVASAILQLDEQSQSSPTSLAKISPSDALSSMMKEQMVYSSKDAQLAAAREIDLLADKLENAEEETFRSSNTDDLLSQTMADLASFLTPEDFAPPAPSKLKEQAPALRVEDVESARAAAMAPLKSPGRAKSVPSNFAKATVCVQCCLV